MNIVTKVRYQNFLAAGNAPIEVNLTVHPTTLVVGVNGAGKSTLHEAICFAWFGRPLRKINKPSLINWINGRDCLVELEWKTTNGANYMVRRGIKPNIFEIYKNGILEPAPANIDDYQTLLESIIKLNHKSFAQVVVLGGSSYIPFMRLSTTARRDIIEDLLDIEVFSAMNALVKDDRDGCVNALDKNSTTRTLVTKQIEMAAQFETHIEEQIKDRLSALDTSITETTETIAELEQMRAELVTVLAKFDQTKKDEKAAAAKVSDYEKTLDKLKTRLLHTGKDRAFYEAHDTCPECEQVITPEFKTAKFADYANTSATLTKAIEQCYGLVQKWQKAEAVADKALEEASRLEANIVTIDAKLPVHRRRLRELEQEKARVVAPKPAAPQVDREALVAELAGLTTAHTTLSKDKVIYDAAAMLLKDNGIKTRIIRHYLPIINKHINHYLSEMDFAIQFTFDEAFEEHIRNTHGTDYPYELFSDGEKKRMDLALLLTWRAVARLKNSASLNLLVMDEVLDSSLDLNGMEEAIKLIHKLEADCNVFVMSHRADANVDKFAAVLCFEKVRGFSQLREH